MKCAEFGTGCSARVIIRSQSIIGVEEPAVGNPYIYIRSLNGNQGKDEAAYQHTIHAN